MCDVSSAGLGHDSDNPVSGELIEWADLIFVMERSHQAKLTARFRRLLVAKRVVCLHIADMHEFMAPALIQLLKGRVTPHLPR